MKPLFTILIACLMPFMAKAEPISWSDITLPVRADQWHQLDESSRTGYIIGAVQAAAYLNAEGDDQIGCVVGLHETLLDETSAPSFSEMVVLAVADRVLDDCGEGASGTGILLSSRVLSESLADDADNTVWTGFIVGMTDFFHFQTYARLGDEKADCVQDESLDLVKLGTSDLLTWTKTPNAPFVEDALLRALSGCGS